MLMCTVHHFPAPSKSEPQIHARASDSCVRKVALKMWCTPILMPEVYTNALYKTQWRDTLIMNPHSGRRNHTAGLEILSDKVPK